MAALHAGGMRAKDVLGQHGENLAADYLQTHGMRIVERNWRCPEGEIHLKGVG
jgi:putative endonuclease